ncbi:AMP-binding protein, partial [Azospirillum isscasi]
EHGLGALTLADATALDSAPAGAPAPAADPDEPALILLTSGSTGVPKGVVGSHRSLLTMIAAVTQLEGFGAADTTLNWMPLDHVGGIAFFSLLPTAVGASQVHVRSDPVLREPLRWPDLMDRHRATIGWAPNFAYALIAQAVAAAADRSWDLSAMRFLVNAGEAVSNGTMVEFFERLSRHGLRPGAIRPSFGMTETASAITTAPWFARDTAVPFIDLGPPVPSAALRIVAEDGTLLKEGEIGQLELSGPQLFRGYFARPDLTAEAFRDGWYRTGDLAYLAGGRLFITGRDKDVIIVNGANFYSHEIETALATLPGLDRTCTAAVGVRTPGAGTDRVAVFFHAPAHGGDDRALAGIVRAIRRRLSGELGVAADLVIPIEPERIPRTSIGKIRRPTLKAWFEAGDFGADVRRVERLTAGPATLPDWFHEKVWLPLPPAPAAEARGAVLAFTGGTPLAAA